MNRTCAAMLALALAASPALAQCRVWTQAFPATTPGLRVGHSMAFDTRDDPLAGMVLFGGSHGSGALGDTWVHDGATWNLRAVTGPPARTFFAMAFDSARNRVVLFGGIDDNGNYLGDTWEWDGVTWSLAASGGPPPRQRHAMAYDSKRQRTVLFGGLAPAFFGHANDTWEWNGATWTQVIVATPPVARSLHAMAYDAHCGRVLLFGGADSTNIFNDTWEFDGAAWEPALPLASPDPRYYHSMAYDSVRRRAVLIGGIVPNNVPAGTWEYDGAAWSQVASDGPSERLAGACAFDAQRARIVHYGGSIGFFFPQGDQWEWPGTAASVVINSHPTSLTVLNSTNAGFSVAASGQGPLLYQWRKNGINLVNGGAVAGADTASLSLTPAYQGDFGAYDCIITNACGSVRSNPAALKVFCYGDADGNNIADFADVTAVFANFNHVCP